MLGEMAAARLALAKSGGASCQLGEAPVEGVGTVAAVVGGGLVAGGLLALAYKAIASDDAPPEVAPSPAPAAPLPSPPKAAMAPPTTTILNTAVTAAQKADLAKEYSASRSSPATASAPVNPEDAKLAAKAAANLELADATEKLRKAKAELTAMLTPDSSGALKTDSTHIKWKTEEVAALDKRVKDLQFVVSGATPDDVDRTLATANDTVTVAQSLLAAVDATQKIVRREAAASRSKVDQTCRKTVSEWLTKHPWLHRLAMMTGGPNLHDLAGADTPESFSERYADKLFVLRDVRILGDAHGTCAVTPQEDRLVLLSLGVSEQDIDSLGLTTPQEDSVYTMVSRGVASVANIFAPGTAKPLTDVADAAAFLATGRQMAPSAPPPQRPKKSDPCAKPKAEAQAAKANAEEVRAAVRRWKEDHPIVNSLFGSGLRSVGDAEQTVSLLDIAIAATADGAVKRTD